MGVIDGKQVTAPVGVGDVRQVLGAATTDVGRLCTHVNVNKWAKYKPVRAAAVNLDLTAYRDLWLPDFGVTAHLPNYLGDVKAEPEKIYEVDGADVAFRMLNIGGLTVPTISKSSGEDEEGFLLRAVRVIRHLKESPELNWAYRHPRGGADEPYRLTDFKGYRHDVRCTFGYDMPGGTVYGNVMYAGLEFAVDDGALSFEDDLMFVLGYANGVGALQWEMAAILTTQAGTDPALLPQGPMSGGGDTLRLEREEVSGLGFNTSAFDVHLCAVNKGRDRIYFFPDAEGSSPWCSTGFGQGIDPDEDGGIGHVSWPQKTSGGTYYCADATGAQWTQKWLMGYHDNLPDGSQPGDYTFYATGYGPASSFSVVGKLRNGASYAVSILADALSATAEFDLGGGETKVKTVPVTLWLLTGHTDAGVDWAQDNGEVWDGSAYVPAVTLAAGQSAACALVFHGTCLDKYSTEDVHGTLSLKYTAGGRTRTLAEYRFAVRNYPSSGNTDRFYSAAEGLVDGEYSLAEAFA